jgi:dihydrodipicolinate synthase/N-acetylneuraminate lyase
MTERYQDTLPNPELERIKDDIAALRRDLAAAVESIRGGAVGSVSGIAQQLTDEASALYREVADRGNKATAALGQKVEEQPLTSVLVSFALGYIVSRLTR